MIATTAIAYPKAEIFSTYFLKPTSPRVDVNRKTPWKSDPATATKTNSVDTVWLVARRVVGSLLVTGQSPSG